MMEGQEEVPGELEGGVEEPESDGQQGRKRVRRQEARGAPTPSTSGELPALLQALAPAGVAPNPQLVGAAFAGRVDGLIGNNAGYWVTISLGGAEWRGSLLCPPDGFMAPRAPTTAAADAAAQPAPPRLSMLKRPKTAFNYFSEHVRDSAKQQHPTFDQKNISRVVGDWWQRQSAADRQPYVEQARADKERYDAELQELHQQQQAWLWQNMPLAPASALAAPHRGLPPAGPGPGAHAVQPRKPQRPQQQRATLALVPPGLPGGAIKAEPGEPQEERMSALQAILDSLIQQQQHLQPAPPLEPMQEQQHQRQPPALGSHIGSVPTSATAFRPLPRPTSPEVPGMPARASAGAAPSAAPSESWSQLLHLLVGQSQPLGALPQSPGTAPPPPQPPT